MSVATGRRLRVNPVLEREMRERMRGVRSAVVLTLYLAALVLVFFLVYQASVFSRGFGVSAVNPTDVARIGRSIFEWVLFIMLVLVLFLVPGMTSAAVSGERERQTLIPMQITLLRPRSIVIGKISASLSFLGLLLVATAPLLALSYLVGGVSLPQALRGLAAVLFTGCLLAAMTVACSAYSRRTQTATVLAYFFVLMLVFGTLIVYWAAVAVVDKPDNGFLDRPAPTGMLWVNPVVLTGAVIGGEQKAVDVNAARFGGPTRGIGTPFEAVRNMMQPRPEFTAVGQAIGPGGPGGPFNVVIDDRGNVVPNGGAGQQDPPATGFENYTVSSIVACLVLIALCTWYASRRLRTPAAIER